MTCARCKTGKIRSGSGNRATCPACRAKARKANRDRNRENDRRRQAIRVSERRELLYAAKAAPCQDCGKKYPPYVMDFDHRPGEKKIKSVSDMLSKDTGIAPLIAEIAKCDLVCANCHRERTYRRLVFG